MLQDQVVDEAVLERMSCLVREVAEQLSERGAPVRPDDVRVEMALADGAIFWTARVNGAGRGATGAGSGPCEALRRILAAA